MALRTCVLPKRLVGGARRTVKQIYIIISWCFETKNFFLPKQLGKKGLSKDSYAVSPSQCPETPAGNAEVIKELMVAAGSAVGSQKCALSTSMAALTAPTAVARNFGGASSISWQSARTRMLSRSERQSAISGLQIRGARPLPPGLSPPQPIANAL